VPTPDLIPIRAYLRNDHELQLVKEVFQEAGAGDARSYSGSAEGSVTEAGLRRLLAENVIIDSLRSVAPAVATDDIQLDAATADVTDSDLNVVASEAFDDTDAGMMDDDDFDEAPESGPSLLSSMGDFASDSVAKSPKRHRFVGTARESVDSLASKLPSVLKRTVVQLGNTALKADVFSQLKRASEEYVQNLSLATGPALLSMGPSEPEPPQEELYEVTVRLPMKAEWRAEIESAGGKINSFSPPNVFLVFLAASKKVGALPFVERVTRYGIEETFCPTLLQALGLAPAVDAGGSSGPSDSTGDIVPPHTFDAILHRQSDNAQAKAAIEWLGGKVTEESPTVLRFEAALDSGMLAALADRPEIKRLAPYVPPRLFSNQARILCGVERINQEFNGSPAGKWNGAGELVAVLDSGIDATHADFEGQFDAPVVYKLGDKSGTADDLVGHGTHVCGIIAGTGKGSDGKIRGMAPGARLLPIGMVAMDAFDRPFLLTPPDLGDLLKEATSRGAKIINLSWGTPLGGSYDQGARQLDKFIYDNPEVLVVIAAGNEGRATKGFHEFNTIGTPASAKNAVTVGACGSSQDVDKTYGTYSAQKFKPPVASLLMCDPDLPAALGSRGPTDYDSVKPDVSACGVYVLAPRAAKCTIGWQPAFDEFNGRYVYLGGTSMAAPVVSGLAAILRQYLKTERNVVAPSAALLKSILVCSAERAGVLTKEQGGPFEDRVGYPDFHQGFGRVDLSRVLPHAAAPAGRKLLFDDVANNSPRALRSHSLAGGSANAKRDYQVTVSNGNTAPLRIVLTWTDFPGNSVQNNLNVYVDCPGGGLAIGNSDLTFMRDALFENLLLNNVPFDKRNTVEHIRIDQPVPGPYIIRVVAQNTPMADQGYALCVVGCVEETQLH
jgi:hypothetical protein